MTALPLLASVGLPEVVLLILYFVPSVNAFVRHHHNQWAIFALNLLLGWTILGWIGALVWSLRRPVPHPQTVHVVHEQAPAPPVEPPASGQELRGG